MDQRKQVRVCFRGNHLASSLRRLKTGFFCTVTLTGLPASANAARDMSRFTVAKRHFHRGSPRRKGSRSSTVKSERGPKSTAVPSRAPQQV